MAILIMQGRSYEVLHKSHSSGDAKEGAGRKCTEDRGSVKVANMSDVEMKKEE